MRTIAGRLVRELERKLPADSLHRSELKLFTRILAQKRDDKHKIYLMYNPDLQCIRKWKESEKYEFGNKVSLMWNSKGIVVGALSFRNEYDGHTLPLAVGQAARLTGITD